MFLFPSGQVLLYLRNFKILSWIMTYLNKNSKIITILLFPGIELKNLRGSVRGRKYLRLFFMICIYDSSKFYDIVDVNLLSSVIIIRLWEIASHLDSRASRSIFAIGKKDPGWNLLLTRYHASTVVEFLTLSGYLCNIGMDTGVVLARPLMITRLGVEKQYWADT